MFESIRELTESRLFPSKTHFRNYTLRDIADFTFLYFLIIQVLKHEFEFLSKVDTYAKNTYKFGDFMQYRQTGNDLYQMLHVLFNESAQENLKDPRNNDILRRRIRPSAAAIRFYLRMVSDKPQVSRDRRSLFDLEQQLAIEDSGYKNIRRLVEKWSELSNDARSLAITRLLLAFRSRAFRSEMLPWLEDLSRRRRYEIGDVCNPETGENCEKFSGLRYYRWRRH